LAQEPQIAHFRHSLFSNKYSGMAAKLILLGVASLVLASNAFVGPADMALMQQDLAMTDNAVFGDDSPDGHKYSQHLRDLAKEIMGDQAGTTVTQQQLAAAILKENPDMRRRRRISSRRRQDQAGQAAVDDEAPADFQDEDDAADETTMNPLV